MRLISHPEGTKTSPGQKPKRRKFQSEGEGEAFDRECGVTGTHCDAGQRGRSVFSSLIQLLPSFIVSVQTQDGIVFLWPPSS